MLKLCALAALLSSISALQLPLLGLASAIQHARIGLSPKTKVPPPVSVEMLRRAVIGSSRWVSHAPPAFFAQEKLEVKGLRANCDVGEPIDASRALVKVGGIAAGAWSCTEGGWLSPSPRTSTETFYMLEGEGSVDDNDGTRHRFGPGDLVVLPRGWNGRWDVTQDLRKIWVVHSHDETPGASTGAVVMTPSSGGGKVYGNGETTVDVWTAPSGSMKVEGSPTEAYYVLEGAAFLTNSDGSAIRCLAGDTVVLPDGWCGRWDVIEALKAVRVVVGDGFSVASSAVGSSSKSRRKPIVGGNWKCNPVTPESLPKLVKNFEGCAEHLGACDVYVCPSNLHVAMVKDSFVSGISVAPQNCNFGGCGAYTGEMAVDQIKAMGMKSVLIGHSERRGEFGLPTPAESNALMATKLQYILDQGLQCIFCIGEPLPIREKGIDAVLAECVSQLKDIVPALKGLEDKSRVVIAYEPVWAIGTGVTATPEQAQETHKAIRDWIASNIDQKTADGIRIQYGGSANAANAPELSAMPDIDGFLVGGASLKPDIVIIVAALAKAKVAA